VVIAEKQPVLAVAEEPAAWHARISRAQLDVPDALSRASASEVISCFVVT
jgi:hypothetical protein